MKYKLLLIGLSCCLGITSSYANDAVGFKILHYFGSSKIDGAGPYAQIVETSNGTLYGTTQLGLLDGGYDPNSGGTIYSIDKSGVEANYAYLKDHSTDTLTTSLVEGKDGNLYGGSFTGGQYGYGNIFKVTTNGIITNIFSFNYDNGFAAFGDLVKDQDGNIYGTTVGGGSKANDGVVFKLDLNNKLTILHAFVGGRNDGSYPQNLVLANDGNLYGTTIYGGLGTSFCVSAKQRGCGTLYSINVKTSQYKVLLKFPATDDSSPRNPQKIISGSDGNLYGVTAAGGDTGIGTFFNYDLHTNQLSVLYSFLQSGTGAAPRGLIQGSDGNFYGVNSIGGGPTMTDGTGTVFEFTKSCMTAKSCPITILHKFTGPDGGSPFGIMQASDGNLYGATQAGGHFNLGVLYEISLKK